MEITLGDTLTCHETGKVFTADISGGSYNYALGSNGAVYSDEGVALFEKRALLDRSMPFVCYLSGEHVTGWKGNVLGRIVSFSMRRSWFGVSRIMHVQVVDIHGNKWHGKVSETGSAVRLFPSKN